MPANLRTIPELVWGPRRPAQTVLGLLSPGMASSAGSGIGIPEGEAR